MLQHLLSLSIKTKITGTIFLILLLFSSGIIYVAKKAVTENINKLASSTVEDIINVNESFIIKSIMEDDTWSIYKFVDSIADINLVRSAGFLDTKGRVVAHTRTSQYPIGMQTDTEAFEDFLRFAISSETTDLGVFVVEIDTSSLQMLFRDFNLHIALFVVLAGLLSFVLAYFISNRILQRLDTLSYNAKMIHNKNFEKIKRVVSKEQDEITQFQNSMESILQQLGDSIESEKNLKNFYHSILQSLNELVLFTDEKLQVQYSNIHILEEKILEKGGFKTKILEEIEKNIARWKNTFVIEQEQSNGKLFYFYVISKKVEQGYALSFADITRLKLLEEQQCFTNSFEIIGEISTGVVHEIKNYLQPVKLLLEQKNLDSEDRARILKIFQKTDTLVNKFLDTGKPIDKDLSQKIVLENLVEQVLFVFADALQNKQIHLQQEIEKDLEIFIGMEDLELIITNLLRNAIDASNQRGVITIKGYTSDENTVLEVIDFGEGIDKNSLRNIAKPFFTTKKSGSGIGLYTTYKTVYMYGGFIEVESVFGLTKFLVYFPKSNRGEGV